MYSSYTLRQKLEVLDYAKAQTEAEAARHFCIPRTTLRSWKGLELQPKTVTRTTTNKGNKLVKKLIVDGHCIIVRTSKNSWFSGYWKLETNSSQSNAKLFSISVSNDQASMATVSSIRGLVAKIYEAAFTILTTDHFYPAEFAS